MRQWPKKRQNPKRKFRNSLALIEIDKNLEKYLPKGDGIIQKAVRYSVLSGGKRIRPLILIESARVCAGSVKDAMPIACAIEFIHTYSLIHDDLPAMDNDDLRRGKPTCHKVFGEANAILAGDALLTLAFGIIARHTHAKAGLEIIQEVSEAVGVNGMVGGQALDMEFQDKKDRNILKKINLLKTAKLFEVSTKAGAIVAGAGRRETAALQKFGLNFGLSFQAVDDLLDGGAGARKEAAVFIERAKKELKIFGKKADKLKAMADYSVKRII
ncbi:MAG: polyprenyl synthetase family protein [Candidatus Omnitrophota bacterium]|nr:polyprenyl synthetase family protein [Candidatus Omnitrophota bacterium]